MNVTLETVRDGASSRRVIAFPMPDGSKRLLTYNAIAEWLGKGIDVVCKRAKTLDPALILSTQNAGVGRKLIPNRDWQRVGTGSVMLRKFPLGVLRVLGR